MADGGVTSGAGACHSPAVDAIFCLVLGKVFWGLFVTVALCPKASASLLPAVLFALAEMRGLDVYVEEEKKVPLLKQTFNSCISSLLNFRKFLYFG